MLQEIEHIEQATGKKDRSVVTSPSGKPNFTNIAGWVAQPYFAVKYVIQSIFHTSPLESGLKNPYADKNGNPRRGFREEFALFELRKKQELLNKLSAEEGAEKLKQREAFYRRMQS